MIFNTEVYYFIFVLNDDGRSNRLQNAVFEGRKGKKAGGRAQNMSRTKRVTSRAQREASRAEGKAREGM